MKAKRPPREAPLDLALALEDRPEQQWLARTWLHAHEARAAAAPGAAPARRLTLIVIGDPAHPSTASRALAERYGAELRLLAANASGKAVLPEARELYRAADLLPRAPGLDLAALLAGAVDPDDGPHGAIVDSALHERAVAARAAIDAAAAPAAARLLDATIDATAFTSRLAALAGVVAEAHAARDAEEARVQAEAEKRLRLPRALRRIALGKADVEPALRAPLALDDPAVESLRGSIGGALLLAGALEAWRDEQGEVVLSGETPSGDRLYARDPEEALSAELIVAFRSQRPVPARGEDGLRAVLGQALRLLEDYPGEGLVLEIARVAEGAVAACYALSPAAPAGRAWKRATAWSDGTCLLVALRPRFKRSASSEAERGPDLPRRPRRQI